MSMPNAILHSSVERHIAAAEPAHLATVCSLEFRTFHNALRILLNIECYELLDAGVIDEEAEYRAFADDPFRAFICMPDRKAAALWKLLVNRQPAALRAPILQAAE